MEIVAAVTFKNDKIAIGGDLDISRTRLFIKYYFSYLSKNIDLIKNPNFSGPFISDHAISGYIALTHYSNKILKIVLIPPNESNTISNAIFDFDELDIEGKTKDYLYYFFNDYIINKNKKSKIEDFKTNDSSEIDDEYYPETPLTITIKYLSSFFQ